MKLEFVQAKTSLASAQQFANPGAANFQRRHTDGWIQGSFWFWPIQQLVNGVLATTCEHRAMSQEESKERQQSALHVRTHPS